MENSLKQRVVNLVANDDLETAIKELLEYVKIYALNSSDTKLVTAVSQRLSHLNKSIMRGKIDFETERRERSHITEVLLSIADILIAEERLNIEKRYSEESNYNLIEQLEKLSNDISSLPKKRIDIIGIVNKYFGLAVTIFVMSVLLFFPVSNFIMGNYMLNYSDSSYRTQNPQKINSIVPNRENYFLEIDSKKEKIDTEIDLNVGDTIIVESYGAIKLGILLGHSVSPNGISGGVLGFSAGFYNVDGLRPHGALLLRVFNSCTVGDWMFCGENVKFVSPKKGTLQFEINDKEKGNNGGSYYSWISILKK